MRCRVPAMTPLVPAQCTRCGYTWQPNAILIENSTNITIENGQTNCPRCGAWARLLEGTFDVLDGAISMKSGPQWSWDLVESLRLGLKAIVEHPPQDPLAAVEDFAPSFGARLRGHTQGWSREQILALIAAIFAILQWADVTPRDIAGWLEKVPERINDLLDEATRNGPPPAPPRAPGPPAGPSIV